MSLSTKQRQNACLQKRLPFTNLSNMIIILLDDTLLLHLTLSWQLTLKNGHFKKL